MESAQSQKACVVKFVSHNYLSNQHILITVIVKIAGRIRPKYCCIVRRKYEIYGWGGGVETIEWM
jgi:hypothetical protein